MIGQLVKIAKPVTEHIARNSGKYILAVGAAIEATVVGVVAYFKGKGDGTERGYEKASKEYKSKFEAQEKRINDIEDKINNNK